MTDVRHRSSSAPGVANGSSTNGTDVVLTIQHPAHVHFFRHVYEVLRDRNYDVRVFARDQPIVRSLLETYDVEFEGLVRATDAESRAVMQARYEWRLLRRARELNPDVMAAIGGVAVSHVATLVGARSVVFTDTEHATLSNALAFPFADTICTPSCYRDDLGGKQHRYEGCHELAYLHPSRFTPDPSVLDDVGLDADQRYAVLRSVDWGAAHDAGHSGFTDVADVVDRLERTGARVLITAEADLPSHLVDRRVDVRPHRMHDLLYYADLFVGEGATMAAESAVLGTPSVYVNTLDTGLTDQLAEEYGLLFRCHGENRQREALDHAVEILEEENGADWERRRIELLADKDDPLDVALDQLVPE